VTNLTKSTMVFVEPVQKCFGKSHGSSAKPEEWSTRPLNTVYNIDMYDVENSLNDIHESWMKASTINWVHKRRRNQERCTLGICESVITFQSRKTINLKVLSTRTPVLLYLSDKSLDTINYLYIK